MQKFNIKKLIMVALLIAMEIILSRFLSIATPIVKIGFGFVPIALVAMLYGPWYAGFAAAAADFLGAILFPIAAYFPGFTLTAALTGVVFGLFLHNREKGVVPIVLAVLIVAIALQLGLDTLWVHIIMGKAYFALLPTRILKCVVIIPLQILCILAVQQWLYGSWLKHSAKAG